jgi:hypothetical protein
VRFRTKTLRGTLQMNTDPVAEDSGMKFTLGDSSGPVPVKRPSNAQTGLFTDDSQVLYSMATSRGQMSLSPVYTAAICGGRSGSDWSTLGGGGVLNIRATATNVTVFGYLGNGATFTYSGMPGARKPDDQGGNWDALSANNESVPQTLARDAMNEVLGRQTGSLGMVIYTPGASSSTPWYEPIIGGIVFSGKGVIGSLGMLEASNPNTANAQWQYTANLIRGFEYSTGTSPTGMMTVAPFDGDLAPAAMYTSATFKGPGYDGGQGLAVDTLSLVSAATQGAGSFFTHRDADPQSEPTINDQPYVLGATTRNWITSTGSNNGIASIRWLSANGTATGNPETGLFSGSFSEFNPLFSKATGLNGSDTAPVRVFGVVLQGYVGQVNTEGLLPGGYGFYLRSGNGLLSNALGVKSSLWTNFGSSTTPLLRQEAMQLVPR